MAQIRNTQEVLASIPFIHIKSTLLDNQAILIISRENVTRCDIINNEIAFPTLYVKDKIAKKLDELSIDYAPIHFGVKLSDRYILNCDDDCIIVKEKCYDYDFE